MVTLSDKDFEKVEYLVGFFNNICEIVLSPEEYLDFNTKDTTTYAIGYGQNQKGNITFSTLESDTIADWKLNMRCIEEEVKNLVTCDYSEEWEKLRG